MYNLCTLGKITAVEKLPKEEKDDPDKYQVYLDTGNSMFTMNPIYQFIDLKTSLSMNSWGKLYTRIK